MWSYLLVHDLDASDAAKLVRQIDKLGEDFVNWHTLGQSSMLLASKWTAEGVSEILRRKTVLKHDALFLVVDTKSDRAGWLPQRLWDFMQDPGPPKDK